MITAVGSALLFLTASTPIWICEKSVGAPPLVSNPPGVAVERMSRNAEIAAFVERECAGIGNKSDVARPIRPRFARLHGLHRAPPWSALAAN